MSVNPPSNEEYVSTVSIKRHRLAANVRKPIIMDSWCDSYVSNWVGATTRTIDIPIAHVIHVDDGVGRERMLLLMLLLLPQ